MDERDPWRVQVEEEPPASNESRLWRQVSNKLGAPPTPGIITPEPAPAPPPRRSRQRLFAALGVAAVIGLAGAVVALRMRQLRAPPAAPQPQAPVAHPPPTKLPGDVSQASPELRAESTLIREAQLALRLRDPLQAVAATARHAATFPHGALAEERDALRTIALCTLRDARQVEARRAFAHDWPGSLFAARVEAACARAPTD